MSLLSALGGIGRGINQGARDYRDWEDFRFQQGQRGRLLTEQKAEDESFGQLRGIQPEGDYTVEQEGPPDVTAGQTTMPTRQKRRTAADVAQDYARVYQQSGARSFLQQAPQMQEQARLIAKRQKLDEGWARVQAELAMDDDTWLVKNLNWYHDNVPDGRGAGIISMPGGQRALVQYDQKTGQPSAPIPITPQLMSDLKQRKALLELGMLTPENFLTAQDVQQKWASVATQGRNADAAMITARSGERRAAVDEANAPAQRGLMSAQANAANAAASASRAAADERTQKTTAEKEYNELMGAYAELTPEQQQGEVGKRLVREAALRKAKFQGVLYDPNAGRGSSRKPVEIKGNPENGYIAFSVEGPDKGRPLYNVSPSGLELPLGLSEPNFIQAQEVARKRGVQARIAEVANGERKLVYVGRDGEVYDALEEALQAKPGTAPKPARGVSPAQEPRQAPAQAPRGIGNTAMFENMSDEQLQRYVKAGNEVAKAVQRQRQAATVDEARRAPLLGIDSGR